MAPGICKHINGNKFTKHSCYYQKCSNQTLFFFKAHENDLKVNLISYLSCQGYVFSPLKRSCCQTSASWRLRLVCTTIPPLKYVFLYRDISEILRASYWLGQSGQDKPQDSFFSLFVNNDPPCWTKALEPSRHCDHRLAWSSACPSPPTPLQDPEPPQFSRAPHSWWNSLDSVLT